jgi:hypothetical protein
MIVMSRAAAAASASACRSSAYRSKVSTSAPYPMVAAVFDPGASCGMRTTAGTPSVRAASATACPWLPEE